MSSNYICEYVGKTIRSLRQAKNLTLAELAQRLKISYQQLQKYEKGTNRLSIDKLYDIARYLGIEVYNFFPGAEISPLSTDNIQKISLTSSFAAIKDPELKAIVLKLVDKLQQI